MKALRDDSRRNREARRSAQPQKEDVIKAFGPMHTTLTFRHVELWCTVNETCGIIQFCTPDGEDMSEDVLRLDIGGEFVAALVLQLPADEAKAMIASSDRAKAVLRLRMEARTRQLSEATRLRRSVHMERDRSSHGH